MQQIISQPISDLTSVLHITIVIRAMRKRAERAILISSKGAKRHLQAIAHCERVEFIHKKIFDDDLE